MYALWNARHVENLGNYAKKLIIQVVYCCWLSEMKYVVVGWEYELQRKIQMRTYLGTEIFKCYNLENQQ